MNPRNSYREAAVRGASPVRLVICLYEQAIEDLRRALIALEKKDIAERTRAVNHALMVIGQLEGTLDMHGGGEVALNLQRFYTAVRAGLIDAQCKQSAAILEQQIALLVEVLDAWLEVERATTAAEQQQPATEKQPGPPLTDSAETSFSNWRA
jgi:flagellar secretion chaperone FliS